MEDKAQYHLLETREQGKGQWIAVIADAVALEKLGTSIDAVKSQLGQARRSPAAASKVIFRGGLHFMTREQLDEQIPKLQKKGMTKSVQALQRAIQCIDDRNGIHTAVAGIQQSFN